MRDFYDPYYMTPEEEAAQIAKDDEQKQDLRDAIAGALANYRGEVYLADIREIVVEELNKLHPLAGEPTWQTKTPIPIPALG
jgi:hypothetical protein